MKPFFKSEKNRIGNLINQRDDDIIFSKVEKEAQIDLSTWKQYLIKKLTPILDSISYTMPVGEFTVNVRFVVERDGAISAAKALNDPGFDLAKFMEQVIRQSPKWNPAEINQELVRSYHTQPVTFIVVSEDECDSAKTSDLLL
jgi:periplasmic protein TonB